MNPERGEVPSDVGPDVERETMENIEPETVPERATETELVLYYKEHIDHPCEVEVAPGQVENLRKSYLIKAREILPTLTNPHAQYLLSKTIEKYSKE